MNILTAVTRSWLTRSTKLFRFTDDNCENLNYTDETNLGLYVHIPFCRLLCEFCPYCKTLYQKELVKRYIESLLLEIDAIGKMNGKTKKQVTSLYFGGGTPSLIYDDIYKIIQRLEQYFVITEGIGLELHPADVTVEKLDSLKSSGVTKISIGVQSFQPHYLELLGRSKENFEKMFAALREVPFETISMDFIFALPDQTISHLQNDIETAFLNGANHVAVYPFVDFTFSKQKFKKLKKSLKKKLFYQLVDYCKQQGYVRDSIWTFSKQGSSKYSSMTRENFLGFGCSATTLLRDQFKINTFDIASYLDRIESAKLPTSLTLKFTRHQRMVYWLFWTAYSMKINPDDFHTFFGKKLSQCYRFEFWLAKLLGFIKKENGNWVITAKGSYYYHYYENFFTLSYIDKMWHLMRTKPFPEKLTIG
jgi:oxygen-independent coproporphyrinogen-3 oxidase